MDKNDFEIEKFKLDVARRKLIDRVNEIIEDYFNGHEEHFKHCSVDQLNQMGPIQLNESNIVLVNALNYKYAKWRDDEVNAYRISKKYLDADKQLKELIEKEK